MEIKSPTLTLAVSLMILLSTASTVLGAGSQGRAPDFRYRSIDGADIRLGTLLKKGPVLLNFWALWCAPCQKELPHLGAISRRYQPMGLTVIVISEDGEDNATRVRSYIKGRNLQMTTIVDRNRDLFRRYRVSVVPSSFLISQNGKIVWQHVGYRPGDENTLEAEIVRLLAESQEAEE